MATFRDFHRQSLLVAMYAARERVIGYETSELPGSPRARKCRDLVDSIDALAEDMTGDRAYFEKLDGPPALLVRI